MIHIVKDLFEELSITQHLQKNQHIYLETKSGFHKCQMIPKHH